MNSFSRLVATAGSLGKRLVQKSSSIGGQLEVRCSGQIHRTVTTSSGSSASSANAEVAEEWETGSQALGVTSVNGK